MSTASRRSSRRSTVVSTLSSTSPVAAPAPKTSPTVAQPTTPTKQASTEIVKEATLANCPLYLECEDDALSVAQKVFHTKRIKEFQEQMAKLESLAKTGARIQPLKDGNVVFRTTETLQPQIQSGIRLLMDPKTGRILGTLNGNNQQQQPPPLRAPPPGLAVRMPGPVQIQPRPPIVMSRNTPTRPVTSPAVVDFTRQTSPATPANKSKPFPALAMQPKPQKAPPAGNSRRSELDSKVKSLLVLPPARFTEWLIQNGLVPVEQYELNGNARSKLKLGMYSDVTKFPHSGGYVWISEANANRLTSVFRGSIFEASNHEPVVVLKLLYHWSCQTNVTNVQTWVKVDQQAIDLYYKLFRSFCIAAVQDEIVNLGGNGKTVEIGVISLGTTTSDGTKREVRVEVLGVLDRATGLMRLRATEPVAGSSQAERFTRIFEPLPIWIHRNTKIITDYSVDKERLSKLGFMSVSQCSAQAKRADLSNTQVMEYLKSVVPKMFQSSLSQLSTSMIQQFLDELTFRECFGLIPITCFDNIIQKIATQTSYAAATTTSLIPRMKNIADNPFVDWRISKEDSMTTLAPISTGSKRSSSDLDHDTDEQVSKKFKAASELVELETYFYSSLQGDQEVLAGEFKADMAFKCHLCKKVYMNNIEFMKHLSLHVESDRASAAVDLADLCQCKYCYKDFETPFAMQSHLEELHLKKGSEFFCRICDETFPAKNQLIQHMSKTHVKYEMPYFCQICGFRSSMHRELIDHFQESHDRTDKLQCPHCLKTFSLFSDKGYNSSVASSFVSHLQMHKDKKVPCKKCILTYHNEQSMKSHVDKDHVSFKSFDNVDVYEPTSNEEPIKMPKPDERNSRPAAKKSGIVKTPQQQSAFAAQNLEDVVMYDVERDDNCGECGRKFILPGHYTAYLCCTKCRYSTCCSKAISVHVALFHGSNVNPTFNLGEPVITENDIFCCCGFKTKSGNKMAKHLAMHGCKSAYPDAESAEKAISAMTSASFAPLVSLEDQQVDPSVAMAKAYCKEKKEEEEKKPEDGPLAFLGLHRKSADGDEDDEKDDKKDASVEPEASHGEEQAHEDEENKSEKDLLEADQPEAMKEQSKPDFEQEDQDQTEADEKNRNEDNDNDRPEPEDQKMNDDQSEVDRVIEAHPKIQEQDEAQPEEIETQPETKTFEGSEDQPMAEVEQDPSDESSRAENGAASTENVESENDGLMIENVASINEGVAGDVGVEFPSDNIDKTVENFVSNTGDVDQFASLQQIFDSETQDQNLAMLSQLETDIGVLGENVPQQQMTAAFESSDNIPMDF